MPNIQVCLSPALFPFQTNENASVVIVDILRATSSICEAFRNGVEKIIPVGTVEETLAYKSNGYVVAAERDGIVLDFADFGNSPDNFTREMVNGRSIAYSTTNGTKTIHVVSSCKSVIIGSFLNISAVCDWLINAGDDVIILCAGWKNRVNIEDSIYAGAVVERLLSTSKYVTDCDSAKIVLSMWQNNCNDLTRFVDLSAQKKRLKKNKLDGCIGYCLSMDTTSIVPVFDGNFLVPNKKE